MYRWAKVSKMKSTSTNNRLSDLMTHILVKTSGNISYITSCLSIRPVWDKTDQNSCLRFHRNLWIVYVIVLRRQAKQMPSLQISEDICKRWIKLPPSNALKQEWKAWSRGPAGSSANAQSGTLASFSSRYSILWHTAAYWENHLVSSLFSVRFPADPVSLEGTPLCQDCS